MSLHSWFLDAKPGDKLTYYVGELARDRATREGDPQALEDAAMAMSLAEKFFAHLLQRRTGPNEFTYTIVRASPEYTVRMRKLWG